MNRKVIVSSRVFEKLILKQILILESKNKLVLTGKQQYGFEKNIKVQPVRAHCYNHWSHVQKMKIVMSFKKGEIKSWVHNSRS